MDEALKARGAGEKGSCLSLRTKTRTKRHNDDDDEDDNDADDMFSGDIIGCYGVFDGKALVIADRHTR